MRAPILAVLTLLASPAAAQLPFVETFDAGSNVGGWTLGVPPSFPTSGGNPGAYHASLIDTFAPQPRTSGSGSPFHGGWRAKGVRSVGIDLRTLSIQFPFDRELTLMLTDDGGTPSGADDWIIYFLGTKRVPQVAEGWKKFDFAVDASKTAMPAGWLVLEPPGGDPDTAWNQVMTNVSELRYFYGDPTFFFIFDLWGVGLDNARISDVVPTTTYCVAKTNSQGCAPAVSLSGAPSASSPSPFLIGASQVINLKNGIMFYGFGPNNAPFQGGTLCVAPPVQRTGLQFSGGNMGPNDCSGSFSLDFNALIQSGVDPLLVAGTDAFAQYWYRDPPASSGSGLSDAAQFTIGN